MRVLLIFFLLSCLYSQAQEITERFELVKLGKEVNTHYHEAAPVISSDGKTLYFFVDNHPDNTYGKDGSQDIWMSTKDENGNWSQAKHLGSPFNDSKSNQVFTIFEDGSLFIKGGRSKNEKGFSIVSGRSKTELNVPGFDKMNNGRFYGATMSADKKHMIIYFSETKNGVLSDLYVSHAQGSDWTTPKKLKISHSLDDFAPFIGPEQKTLYFASNRPAQGRQGNADIYKCARLDDTWENWSQPVNMGSTINTRAMDAYFSIDKLGDIFVSRSNSRVDGGNLDLFVLIEKSIKINLAGMVFNEKTKTPIQASVEVNVPDHDLITLIADEKDGFETRLPEVSTYSVHVSADGFLPVEQNHTLPRFERDTTIIVDLYLKPIAKKLMIAGNVYNQKTNQLISADLNLKVRGSNAVNIDLEAQAGKYERNISKLGWYIISASKEGYLNVVDSIYVPTTDVTPVIKDIYLQPIEVGVTVRLKNVYFDFDKTTLKSESFTELDKVVEFLSKNSSVEIEIAGHTDDKGSDSYNKNLSQGRCQSVVDYISSQGIEAYRLVAKGYGEARPIDTNETDEGRANNRRVEFTVLRK